jgi:hypothetical protein
MASYKKTSNTQKIITAASIFILASTLVIATTMITAQAQTSNDSPTYCFVVANPNPIGVNQTALVDFWMADVTPNAVGATGDFYSDVTVKITDPTGTVATQGPYTLNSLATGFFDYTPKMAGNYTFQMIYPGNDFTDININYLPSQSAPFTLIVQDQPISQPPQTPLPTAYWQRPINAQNYLWSAVSSNWLMAAWNETGGSFFPGARAFDDGSSFAGEGQSPDSAHILWTAPLAFGGLAGGQYGSVPYYQGASYEQYFTPPVIINGILYYNTILGQEPSTSSATPSITAVDLRNGQTLFTIQNVTLTLGQIYNYVSPNQAGTFAYLWSISGSTWKMYDAATGSWILTLVGVPSGVIVPASDGSLLVYSLTENRAAHSYTLSLWNSSQAIAQDNNHDPALSNDYWTWRPYSWQTGPSQGIVNATGTTPYFSTNAFFQPVLAQQDTNGTMWKVEEPYTAAGLTLSPEFNQGGWFDGADIVAGNPPSGFGAAWDITSTQPIDIAAYDMATGAFDFKSTLLPPANLPNDFGDTIEESFQYNGVFYNFIKQTLQWAAWDIQKGGQPMWISQPYANPWGMYAQSGGEMSAFDIFYAAGWDGEIHAYNVTNGNEQFTFSSANSGYETPYGVYPFYGGITVTADGKIFAQTGQHGNGVPTLYRGQALYVVDAKTGQSLWNMTGWFNYGAMADGVWVTQNNYDNQIYAFGKGPSAVTVSATPGVGNTVTIQGTVTDQSPGAAGTAAIADQYMSEWMAYQYEQQTLPDDFPCATAGVEVTLSAIDPNGNSVNIGSAVSDSNGHYSLKWDVPTDAGPGIYTITAAFNGTNSYYGSNAETSVATTAVTPTPTPTPTPPVVDTYFIPAVIAIIVVVIIVGAILAVLMLKKRP